MNSPAHIVLLAWKRIAVKLTYSIEFQDTDWQQG